MADRFFPYRFDRRFAPVWLAFGARPSRDGVTLTDDGRFRATFGLLGVETQLDNVRGGHVTDGYRWFTAVGARRSFVDDGLTFGTNRDRGVCVHFHERIRGLLGAKGHSALTVTVEDCEGLVAAIGDDTPSAG